MSIEFIGQRIIFIGEENFKVIINEPHDSINIGDVIDIGGRHLIKEEWFENLEYGPEPVIKFIKGVKI